MGRTYLAMIGVVCIAGMAGPAMAHVTECDWVGGHPSEPLRQAPGVAHALVNYKGAVFACERDLAADPDNEHLMYQLGLLLYYDHPLRDWQRSLDLISAAAQKGYPQAQFVLGLIYSDGILGDIAPQNYCTGAKHHLAAARWGRYASLISYSRYALKGYYDNCSETVDWLEVARFLDLARGAFQYDWYDGLLVDDLEELLASRIGEK